MKKRNKIILIILAVVVLVVLLATMCGLIDYNIAADKKRPVFSLIGKGIDNQFVIASYSETEWEKENISTNVYFGLGYKIIVCNNKENDVYILPLYIGNRECSYESNAVKK